jgi:hypothetical protein
MTTDVPQRTHGGKGVGTNAGYLQGYILGTIAIFEFDVLLFHPSDQIISAFACTLSPSTNK